MSFQITNIESLKTRVQAVAVEVTLKGIEESVRFAISRNKTSTQYKVPANILEDVQSDLEYAGYLVEAERVDFTEELAKEFGYAYYFLVTISWS